MRKQLAVVTILQLLAAGMVSAAPQKAQNNSGAEILIDAVVANVDGKPITLEDVKAQVPGAKVRSLGDASSDPSIREALDHAILNEVLESESKSRHISVAPDEISQYMDEVARRNNLSPAALEKEIAKSGRSVESYKNEIKAEILRTKILGQEISNSVQVTDQEIEDYIKLHSTDTGGGSTVTLRQFDNEQGTGPGTLLSDLQVSDLSPQIVDAITGLKIGALSRAVETPNGKSWFKVESRSDDEEFAQKLRAEARDKIKQTKVAERAASFLQTDIYKKHTIDRVF